MAAYTTIDDPTAFFQIELYTGTGSSNARTFDSDTNLDLSSGGVVWIKSRSDTEYHRLYDTVRGVHKEIYTNASLAEGTNTNSLTAFGSDGFTVGSETGVNANTETHVAWCWKESATAGFDIVSYTGNSTNRTISHNLSAVPKMMIVRNLQGGYNWIVYHVGNGATKYMYLDTDASVYTGSGYFNDTTPTSSVFTVGTDAQVNTTSATIMAYVFADVQGFSKFGTYKGNANADGPFVYTGFRPARIMLKDTQDASTWMIMDNKRSGYNPTNNRLYANTQGSEESAVDRFDILSNGFKIRTTDADTNKSGDLFIYAAFAEAPFVNSNGVPCNAR